MPVPIAGLTFGLIDKTALWLVCGRASPPTPSWRASERMRRHRLRHIFHRGELSAAWTSPISLSLTGTLTGLMGHVLSHTGQRTPSTGSCPENPSLTPSATRLTKLAASTRGSHGRALLTVISQSYTSRAMPSSRSVESWKGAHRCSVRSNSR